ncbi:MAG: hypothetical protein R3E12_14415 [Candidatus Eisenbacteria bacterium]
MSRSMRAGASAADSAALDLCIDAARRTCRASLRRKPSAERAPRGAAARTRRGEIFEAPELAWVAGVGGSAEQVAVWRARLASRSPITHVVVRGGKTGRSDGGPPNAATLQVLLELAPRALLYWGTDRTPRGGVRAAALLPGAFSPAHLDGSRGKPA